ncbi:MAG: hypothetical protein Q9159_005391 [Coniocarpon cinnabarinum]
MLFKLLSSLSVFALALGAALPQTNPNGYSIFFTAYPASDIRDAGCLNGGASSNGHQNGALTKIGDCVPVSGEAGDQFWWSTNNVGMLVGLFKAGDCNGDYKSFMASQADASSPGTGCVNLQDLTGNPDVTTYASVKILADCSKEGGCDFGQ